MVIKNHANGEVFDLLISDWQLHDAILEGYQVNNLLATSQRFVWAPALIRQIRAMSPVELAIRQIEILSDTPLT